MGARFSLSTYLHWFLRSEYDIHFVSLQTHLFVVGFDEQIFTRHPKDELKDKDERLELWQKPKTSTIWLYDFE